MNQAQNAREEVEKRKINKELLGSDVKILKDVVGAICDMNDELERVLV